MEMVSTNYVQYGQQLLAQRRITRDQIDDAVRRILLVKVKLGLFERPYADEAVEVKAPSPAALAASRQAAGRCMVLLKNDGPVLPLAKTVGSVAVVGPLGNATYDLNGTWSGLGTGAATTPPVTVVDGIKAAAPGAAVTFTMRLRRRRDRHRRVRRRAAGGPCGRRHRRGRRRDGRDER